ncbi:MAG: PAS domain-containing protein, partial [Gemmatimonadota bacterium]
MQAAASAYPIFGTPRLAAEIVASLHEPFALLDSELRLVAASPSFYRRFGLEASAAVGSLVYDLGHGEWDTPGARHLLDDLAPRREVVEGYSLEVRGTAVERPRVVVSVRPVRHGENQITCYLLAFIDPAPAAPPDDVRVRRAPWESADLLAVIDPNGHRFATLDGAVRTLTGYAPGQLEGR